MWITCMKKKKAKFKSYSIQNVMIVTCMLPWLLTIPTILLTGAIALR